VENDKIFQPAEEDLVINGKPLSHTYPDGKIVNPHYPLNPVSIDSEMKWVYFGALGGHKIYRIATENLANENLSDNQLSKQIEFFANKPKSDGFKIDKKGQIYVTDVENNAIAIATSKGYKILVQDKNYFPGPMEFPLLMMVFVHHRQPIATQTLLQQRQRRKQTAVFCFEV